MNMQPTNLRARKPRTSRSRAQPNPLRDWLERKPRPMPKIEFAARVGCSPSYVSQLIADLKPWPSREIALQIAIVTEGAVTPNLLAGYPPTD